MGTQAEKKTKATKQIRKATAKRKPRAKAVQTKPEEAVEEPKTTAQKAKVTYSAHQVMLAARSAYSVACDNRRTVNERANAFTYRVLRECGLDPAKSHKETPVTVLAIVNVAYDILDADKTDRLFDALESKAAF